MERQDRDRHCPPPVTIAAMDRLIVMNEGHIVEEGTHKQLLAKGGI